MPAPTATRDADRVLAASVALQRISGCIPPNVQIMRGTFYGILDADIELQFADVAGARQTAEALRCGLVHERCDTERGELTKQLRRRHLWVGDVGDVPTIIWAFEDLEELPEPEQGARFHNPWTTPEASQADAEAPPALVSPSLAEPAEGDADAQPVRA